MYDVVVQSEKDANSVLKLKTSYGHAIALWKKRFGIAQKRLII